MSKYKVGQKIMTAMDRNGDRIYGDVIENFKLPGDICVKWDTGETMSYDESFLDEWFDVVPDEVKE